MRTWGERQSLAQQARLVFKKAGYDRKGGKLNRKQQMERACTVMDWVQRNCQIHHLGQLGGRQIVQFWKTRREWSDATRYGYWLALRQLWRLYGKPGEPPEPDELDPSSTPATDP